MMSVRPFDWRDLPALNRYRHQSVFLNSELVLTRGPLVLPGALLSFLAPGVGLITGVINGEAGHPPLIGQAIHSQGSQFAHLTFLAPDIALESPALSALFDYLVSLAGERGAMRLMADVDDRSPAFEALRQASFAIYTRQRIWQLVNPLKQEKKTSGWRPASERDGPAIRSLYTNIVPGLVQQVEPYGLNKPRGMILQQGKDILAYVELKYGYFGIWAQPFVHPDVEEIAKRLEEFLSELPIRRSRPLYVCVRSYQSWLEPAIEDLGAEPGPRQAVMVKHLAVAQKAARTFALPALEGGSPEISAPAIRMEKNQISYGTEKNHG